MIRYYKLFDLLNRKGMKRSDLRQILSPNTVAKLSKGANLNTDVIDKICLFLHCQPNDIMEVVEVIDTLDDTSKVLSKPLIFDEGMPDDMEPIEYEERFVESIPKGATETESDEEGMTERHYIPSENDNPFV